MANFAELDIFYTVLRVVALDNNEMLEDGIEKETVGAKKLHDMLGGTWVQTSYNTWNNQHRSGGTPFRKNYACIGGKYDPARDAFMSSNATIYPSWVLNEDTCQYDSPVPYPTDDKRYEWDEETTNWKEII
jgi:hypothetical protein